jgi:D-alanyl-D-alanine carboxypeptidase
MHRPVPTLLRAIHGLLAAMLLFTVLLPSLAAAPRHAPGPMDASAIAPPDVTAKSVYVMDMTSGVELYAKNPDEHLQVGSIVKIATALVTMQHAELDEQVVIIEQDLVDVEQFSNMNLTAGDTLTVSQLLYGLLIPSGNDGAKALARHVGSKISGSDDPRVATEAFVKEMNAYGASIGLQDTRFTVPDGIDTPNSYSSAYDVTLMARELMRNDFLRSVVQEPGYRFFSVGPEGRLYEKATTNQRLGQNGVVGVKTGTTVEAGGNVVLAREVNGGGNIVLITIIGADHAYSTGDDLTPDARWGDADTLITAMDSTFTWSAPNDGAVLPGLAEQMTVWDVRLQDPPAIPVPTAPDVELAYQLQVGPVTEPGEPAGTVHLFFGEENVGTIPVYQADSAAASPSTRMTL